MLGLRLSWEDEREKAQLMKAAARLRHTALS